MELSGRISNISTRSKFDDTTETVVHLTTFKVSIVDLDRDTLEKLAEGEFHASLVTMELLRGPVDAG